MIQRLVDRVTAFHEKHGFPTVGWVALREHDDYIRAIAGRIQNLVAEIEQRAIREQELGDPRLYRLCLMLEELSELAEGMGIGSDVAVFDGGIDLLYVLLGTIGTTYSLPLDAGWDEVCKSNESKAVRTPDNPRMRDKGPDYFPPHLAGILRQHRCKHSFERVGETQVMGSYDIRCAKCGKESTSYE